jgi:nucleoid DNA-binding protein
MPPREGTQMHAHVKGKRRLNPMASEAKQSVTKQDLVKRIVTKTGKTNKEIGEVLSATLDSIRECLEKNEEVRLINFGVFSVRKSAARPGVNPKTGAKMEVPEKMRVKFAPGKELNEAVAALNKPAPAKKK